MIRFKIDNLPPYNGEFPLDIDRGFTNRELHTIKEVAGVRGNEVEEALNAEDNDVLVALCVIALRRAGLPIHMDTIWDAPAGAIKITADEEEADAGPPDLTPPAESGSGNERQTSSGNGSSKPADLPVNLPSPTGTPGSELSAT